MRCDHAKQPFRDYSRLIRLRKDMKAINPIRLIKHMLIRVSYQLITDLKKLYASWILHNFKNRKTPTANSFRRRKAPPDGAFMKLFYLQKAHESFHRSWRHSELICHKTICGEVNRKFVTTMSINGTHFSFGNLWKFLRRRSPSVTLRRVGKFSFYFWKECSLRPPFSRSHLSGFQNFSFSQSFPLNATQLITRFPLNTLPRQPAIPFSTCVGSKTPSNEISSEPYGKKVLIDGGKPIFGEAKTVMSQKGKSLLLSDVVCWFSLSWIGFCGTCWTFDGSSAHVKRLSAHYCVILWARWELWVESIPVSYEAEFE